jgi:RND family efflux transporter MFP subunit
VERLRSEHAALERLVAKQAATPEELARSRVALERAEADARRLEQQKSELARRSKLDAERAQLLADRSRNEIDALEEKARQADLASPVDGTLYLLPVRAGDYVRVGDLLAEMADLRKVRVRAFVDEPDLGMLEPGQPVEITWDALASRVWQGRTEQVPKAVVARGTRSVGEVLCSAANDPVQLLPNTNVNVRIRVRERPGVLVVPRGAVRAEGSRRFVFLVEEGTLGVQASTLHKKEIKVGISSATSFEILEGLKEGDMVALPGDVELGDGIQVRVVMEQ